MNQADANPIASLTALGFSEYEARAYLELLQNSPVSAYELAKNSGLPSSKIYETCARLVERGAAIQLAEAGKLRYAPLSPNEFIASQRLSMENRLSQLATELRDLGQIQRLSYIWNISDRANLNQQLHLLVHDTQQEIILSGWASEIQAVGAELLALRQAGVRIAILQFGPGQLWPADAKPAADIPIYHHPIEDTLYRERGGRGLTVVSDGKRALMATISDNELVQGAWSLNRGFVLLAEDYVKHDIYLMKIITRMDDRLCATFGDNYFLLRDIFSDRDTTAAEEEKK